MVEINILSNLIQAFILGVLTPLTAVCVLPLYPAFLTYLTKQLNQNQSEKSQNQNQILKFAILISLGVISFMFVIGLIFTTFLQISLTKVIGIISPIAFIILFFIGLGLIFNFKIPQKYFPKFSDPTNKNELQNPNLKAYFYGFFFGSVVIPCNPLLIAALFTTSVTISSFIINILQFLFFGLGISAPLLLFAIISKVKTDTIILFLLDNSKLINRISGILITIISLYYLIFVFRIFG